MDILDEIAKHGLGVMRAFTVPVTSLEIVGPNPKRVALIFFRPDANTYTITTDPVAVFLQGINLGAAGDLVMLLKSEVGDLVTRAWSAIASPAPSQAAVIEVMIP